MSRFLIAALAAAAAVLALAASAGAASLVYVAGGNLWLSSPDGSARYQLTYDGAWSQPSQADDGTLYAMHGALLTHLDRSAHVLGTPVPLVGSDADHSGNFKIAAGPLGVNVSPDGKRVAYWLGTKTFGFDWHCNCTTEYTQDLALYSYTDRFTAPDELGVQEDYRDPRWLDNDRAVLFNTGLATNVVVDQVGAGRNSGAAWLDRGMNGEGEDGGASCDGRTVAFLWNYAAGSQGHVVVGSVDAPGALPQTRCAVDGSDLDFEHPSVSPDGRYVAYVKRGEGIHVMNAADCGGDTLLVPGKGIYDPSFGPADVDPRQAPPAPGSAPAPAPATPPAASGTPTAMPAAAPALSRLTVARRGRTLTVRFTLDAPATVTLRLRRGTTVVLRRALIARAGRTTVRLTPRRLRAGRYVLDAAATSSGASTHARRSVSVN